jgi:hypothetical protein
MSGLSLGSHTVSVRAGDCVSNVGTTATLTVWAAPVTTFADGFESGGLGAWSSSAGGGLAVNTTSALAGRYGLGITATRTGGSVRASVPGSSGPVNARILFDPRSMATGSAVVPVLVESTSTAVWTSIAYRPGGGSSQVRVSGRTAAGAVKVATWFTISSTGASVLELDGQQGSGSVTFYVADTARTTLTGLSSAIGQLIA